MSILRGGGCAALALELMACRRTAHRRVRAVRVPLCSASPSMHARAQLYLARHGQTAYNLEGRFQGHLPVPLDATGRAQAAELAERAAAHGFRALWCSPLLRARETADAVAERIGLEAIQDARLMETDAGDWTDRSFAEVHARSARAVRRVRRPARRASRFRAGSPSPHQRERVERGSRRTSNAAACPPSWSATGWSSASPSRAGRGIASSARSACPTARSSPLDPAEVQRADLGGGGRHGGRAEASRARPLDRVRAAPSAVNRARAAEPRPGAPPAAAPSRARRERGTTQVEARPLGALAVPASTCA